MDALTAVASLNTLLDGKNVQMQLSVPSLVESVIERKEGILTATGAVAVKTGKYTGRSPKDKYIVDEPEIHKEIDWGEVNRPLPRPSFLKLYHKVLSYLKDREKIFVFKGYAGADPRYRVPIQVISEFAWHNLFAHQLFIRPAQGELSLHESPFSVVCAPGLKADPEADGTRSETFIIISFKDRVVLIGGTEYAGEVKKSIFTVMNYLLPKQGIFPMHCSANVGKYGDVALFFGLSGTGKTTLSADPERRLLGDDEHGWSEDGIFNIEGGCYAKCIHLSQEKEPQIYNAIRFGAVLENVVITPDGRVPDFHDHSLTENTRAAYPIHAIENIVEEGMAGHPNTIIFLTADAFGVLPPISILTREQAMYHFLSGYTSKLAGTERGVTEPEATFSTCYGAPFLPLAATEYARMLGEKIERHDVNVFLVNTGWIGGSYGEGERIPLSYTRKMVKAAINGLLNEVQTIREPVFGLHIPEKVPGIPSHLLFPEQTWKEKGTYRKKARALAGQFRKNFEKMADADPLVQGKGGRLSEKPPGFTGGFFIREWNVCFSGFEPEHPFADGIP